MKFGSREIANVVFRAKATQRIGNTTFKAGQPVLYIDTATTSTVEGAATSVYAQGGRGNTRLVTWEGEKTLTFTVEDALLSPIGMAILSGAGLWSAEDKNTLVHVHTMTGALIETGTVSGSGYDNTTGTDRFIDLRGAIGNNKICMDAPLFVMETEPDGSITGKLVAIQPTSVEGVLKVATEASAAPSATPVMVDYYMLQDGSQVSELQIEAEKFAGYFYVEAETLFRRQDNGVDMPANLTFPNVKIQSNFSFSMSATGDPSTFSFVMDAMPGYTYFNKTKKVLCAIQFVSGEVATETPDTVFGHTSYELDARKEAGDKEWIDYDSTGDSQVDKKDSYSKA